MTRAAGRIRGTNRAAAGPGRRLARIFVPLGRLISAPQGRRFSCKIAPRPISGAGVFGRLAEARFWFAAIAQLVEHVIRNDGVTGSSPVCGTSLDPPPNLPELNVTHRSASRVMNALSAASHRRGKLGRGSTSMVFDLISPLPREECVQRLKMKADPAWSEAVTGSVSENSFRLRKRTKISFQIAVRQTEPRAAIVEAALGRDGRRDSLPAHSGNRDNLDVLITRRDHIPNSLAHDSPCHRRYMRNRAGLRIGSSSQDPVVCWRPSARRRSRCCKATISVPSGAAMVRAARTARQNSACRATEADSGAAR